MDALAAEVFTASAKNGDVDSYAALGNMYARGIHFKKDYEEAYKWLKLASDSGHATAMFELSKFYIEGYGIPKDEKKAVTLIRNSAELGEPSAQQVLGLLYQFGEYGVEKDERESLVWLMKSAKGNDALAQLKVGDAYLEGNLLSKDIQKAIEYWTKSAEQNNIDSMKRLRTFYIDGVEDIEANVELAIGWTLKAAELDDCEAQRMLGVDYLIGTHIDVDYSKAAYWSKKAADKGDSQAQYALGVMYKRGFFEDGVNMDEARHWFSLSASQGFQLSIDELNSINDV
jgi:TPR repeat protein